MTRKECLDAAAGCVLKDMQNQYGGPEDSFGMIARMWGAYLGVCVSAHDVAAMMALLKIARFRHNPFHEDNAVDCAGYAACMVETATAWEREGEDEAEGSYCQNGNDQPEEPEFKPGDKVQVYYPSIEEWRDATYVSFCQMSRDCWRHEVEFASGGRRYVPREQIRPTPKTEGCEYKKGDKVQCRITLPSVSDRLWVDGEYVRYEKGRSRPHVVFTNATLELVSDEDIRPAPKAEGCEALVEQDAPQTPEETCQRIVDSNPATYGQLRTPTGEELAEMAEEDGNA